METHRVRSTGFGRSPSLRFAPCRTGLRPTESVGTGRRKGQGRGALPKLVSEVAARPRDQDESDLGRVKLVRECYRCQLNIGTAEVLRDVGSNPPKMVRRRSGAW